MQVGDKVVQVGPPLWEPYVAILEECDRCKLRDNIATVDLSSIKQALPVVQQSAAATGTIPLADLLGALVGVVVDNLPNAFDLGLKHPPLVQKVIVAGTNLTADDMKAMNPGEVMRVFRAAANELQATGVFEEMIGFFADRLGLVASAQKAPAAPPTTQDTPLSAAA